LELARVGAFEVDQLRYKVAFAHGFLDPELKVWEAFNEAGKKPGPRLGVQRRRLQARGGMRDEICRPHIRLRRVIATVEDVDPPAGGCLVAFNFRCVTRLARLVGRCLLILGHVRCSSWTV
jgi:hypothetical protein